MEYGFNEHDLNMVGISNGEVQEADWTLGKWGLGIMVRLKYHSKAGCESICRSMWRIHGLTCTSFSYDKTTGWCGISQPYERTKGDGVWITDECTDHFVANQTVAWHCALPP